MENSSITALNSEGIIHSKNNHFESRRQAESEILPEIVGLNMNNLHRFSHYAIQWMWFCLLRPSCRGFCPHPRPGKQKMGLQGAQPHAFNNIVPYSVHIIYILSCNFPGTFYALPCNWGQECCSIISIFLDTREWEESNDTKIVKISYVKVLSKITDGIAKYWCDDQI